VGVFKRLGGLVTSATLFLDRLRVGRSKADRACVPRQSYALEEVVGEGIVSSAVYFRRAMEAVEQISDETPPWEDILSTARDLIGADGGSLIMMDGRGNLLNLNYVNVSDVQVTEYATYFHKLDFISSASINFAAGTWLDSNELFPRTQLRRTEFYTDFLHKHRNEQIVTLLLERSAERRTGISFQRSSVQDGAGETLSQGTVGTYFRSFMAALGRRGQSMANNLKLVEDAFAALDEATFLLTSSGIVLHPSGLAKSLLDNPRGLSIKQGKLWHQNPAVLSNLSKAVAATLQSGQRSRVTVSLTWGEALSLDFAVADSRIRLSNEPLVFVRMRRNSVLSEADADNLIATFNVTKAEARVLAGLVGGLAPSELAIQNGVSEHTVRSQISNLKRKMHCSRIVDLVKLALLAQG
jgi:DNA-binding CsgD family transcriptional regulator